MEILQIIVLGVVQGITEFIPVSSSGHLILLQNAFGFQEAALSLTIFLHFGTFFSVVAYYWVRIVRMVRQPLDRFNFLVVLTAVPAGVVGVLFSDFFQSLYTNASLLGYSFLLTAVLLYTSSLSFTRVAPGRQKGEAQLRIPDVLWMGVFQCLAILPGVSRSGATLSAGLFRKIDKRVAAEVSFLNSIILILGANVLEMPQILQGGGGAPALHLAIGFVASAVSGYLAIAVLLRVLRERSLRPFSYYVAVLGVLVLLDQWFFRLVF